MNVLWGRVVVLGVVLLLVFLLGRATSGSSAEVQDLQERLEDREAEIDQLEAANREAANATPTDAAPADGTTGGTADGTTGGTTTTTTTPTPTVTPTATSTAAANTEAQTYTVKSGDNLGRISTRFYGTVSLAKCIQEANQIANASAIQVGKSLTIPPKASCTATGTTASPSPS